MFKSLILNKYVAIGFSKVIFNTIFTFACLAFIMNIFEEFNFFKDLDVGIYLPIFLSIIIIPSLLYKMLPFIFLLAGIIFFLKIKKSDEVTAMKVSGMSNFSIMLIPCFVAVLIGIFFITIMSPITSTLVKKYEITKGSYDRDQDYLAAITENGIWIKEKNENKNNIIRSTFLKNQDLIDVTIFEFDNENNLIRRIQAKSANIEKTDWVLQNVKILGVDGELIENNLPTVNYTSIYDLEKIKNLYSNLETISFWKIGGEIKLLEERGYSTKLMETKLQRSLAFPFFLLAMVLLSAVFTLGVKFKDNNLFYIFVSIITCVLVYFFNDFSAALGRTEKLSVEIAVWMPIVIIFLFASVGVIYANQK